MAVPGGGFKGSSSATARARSRTEFLISDIGNINFAPKKFDPTTLAVLGVSALVVVGAIVMARKR